MQPDSTQTQRYLPLRDHNVVLGVTGSIAAYKAADLASKLVQQGAAVDVILTESATEFVGPTTFAALTHRPVTVGLFGANSALSIDHVALAMRANVVVVAPATANTLAKIAMGLSDDPLGATILATSAPIIVAPAMDGDMYDDPATQWNVQVLRERGVHVIEPGEGRLASGLTGRGRLEEPARIIEHMRWVLGRGGDYSHRRVVITAGGTQEPLDPVRYLTNRSSGKMGYALAEAARGRGADVTLVTTPTALPDLVGVTMIKVNTAREMHREVLQASADSDLLVMAAAVADYRPAKPAPQKIKKGDEDTLVLELARNPDIITEATGPRLVKVAFAAETMNAAENAKTKAVAKGAAFVVANDVTEAGSGFGTDTNRVAFVDAQGNVEQLPLMNKLTVAHAVLDRAQRYLSR